MRARIGFVIILGSLYAVLALIASFGITSFHFWSGIVGFVALASVLPVGILSIWRATMAGWLLIVASIVFSISALFSIESREEIGVLAVGLPILFSGLLLIRRPPESS
jgi:hypothetical protein